MLNVNLKQLEVFVCVAELQSFSAAAEKLYLSQSTVSSHIAALETALGVTLLDRGSRRRVELTPSGRDIFLRSQHIVQSCLELQAAYTNPTGELHIGASTVPMDYILPQLMAGFLGKNPGCQYVLHRGNSTSVHQMLAEGQIHLGLVGTVLNRKDVVYRRLCTDHLVVVTPNTPPYQILQQQGILGRELLSMPLIVRTAGSGTQMAVDRYLTETGIPTESIHVVARIDSTAAILQAVSQGLGVCMVSSLAAREWVAQGKLLSFPPEPAPLKRELYLIYSKDIHLAALAQSFADFAEAACAEKFY